MPLRLPAQTRITHLGTWQGGKVAVRVPEKRRPFPSSEVLLRLSFQVSIRRWCSQLEQLDLSPRHHGDFRWVPRHNERVAGRND
jgi:hypothetical protein